MKMTAWVVEPWSQHVENEENQKQEKAAFLTYYIERGNMGRISKPYLQ